MQSSGATTRPCLGLCPRTCLGPPFSRNQNAMNKPKPPITKKTPTQTARGPSIGVWGTSCVVVYAPPEEGHPQATLNLSLLTIVNTPFPDRSPAIHTTTKVRWFRTSGQACLSKERIHTIWRVKTGANQNSVVHRTAATIQKYPFLAQVRFTDCAP